LYSVATPGALDPQCSVSNGAGGTSSEITPTANRPVQAIQSWLANAVNGVARGIHAVFEYLTTPSKGLFDDSEFKYGIARNFPECPGEEHRSRALPQIREQYNPSRDADGYVTPVHREQRSRSVSCTRSIAFERGAEAGPSTPRDLSPYSPLPPRSPRSPRSPTASPSTSTHRTPRATTLPNEQTSFELQSHPSSACANPTGEQPPQRRNTLEVPPMIYHSPLRSVHDSI
jgi:hypothetical protein